MVHSNAPLKQEIPPKTIHILLASDQNVWAALDQILRHSNWRLRHVTTCREAVAFAKDSETGVVICQQHLPDGDWTTVLTEFATLPTSPNLIVTSRLPDDILWAEVLNLGGYDVLAQPFGRNEVFRVVSSAWRQWNDLWQPHPRFLSERDSGVGSVTD
jgi:DNA-binding response OmpR family regulator